MKKQIMKKLKKGIIVLGALAMVFQFTSITNPTKVEAQRNRGNEKFKPYYSDDLFEADEKVILYDSINYSYKGFINEGELVFGHVANGKLMIRLFDSNYNSVGQCYGYSKYFSKVGYGEHDQSYIEEMSTTIGLNCRYRSTKDSSSFGMFPKGTSVSVDRSKKETGNGCTWVLCYGGSSNWYFPLPTGEGYRVPSAGWVAEKYLK